MSNNGDDFQDDQVDFGDDGSEGGYEDFEGGGATLGDMWRNNPLVKIGIIAGGVITVVGAIVLFGGQKEQTLQSRVRPAEDITAVPGGEVSDVYRKAVEEENVRRTEEAIRQRGSAIPTPIDTPVERLILPEEQLSGEDPLERWRRIQEERQRQASARKEVAPVGDPYADAVDALANAMAGQMEGILGAQKPLEPVFMNVTSDEFIEQKRQREREAALASAGQKAGAIGADVINILIPSGEMVYAQLITEANSDIPGPILAQLVAGPFAGSRLLGNFKAQDDYLVLTFETIVIDGIPHSADAIALNPETTSIGMVTDIDRRYFTRVILPAAAAFVEGMGEAIAQSGTTTVTVSQGAAVQGQEELDARQEFAKGFEKAAEKVGEILDENASSTKPLIRVERGTPMALLFLTPVEEAN